MRNKLQEKDLQKEFYLYLYIYIFIIPDKKQFNIRKANGDVWLAASQRIFNRTMPCHVLSVYPVRVCMVLIDGCHDHDFQRSVFFFFFLKILINQKIYPLWIKWLYAWSYFSEIIEEIRNGSRMEKWNYTQKKEMSRTSFVLQQNRNVFFFWV